METYGCCGTFDSVDFAGGSSHTGMPVNANIIIGFLILGTLASPPVSAESPCAECIQAAQKELRDCLDNAISVDDKNTCEEKREEGMKACEDKECTVERETRESQKDKSSQDR